MSFDCECKNWARVAGHDLFIDDAHHSRCPLFKTQSRPRLFYWEEAVDAWVPAPDRVHNIIDAESHFASPDDEPFEIRFKRVDLTDKEYAELPDADDTAQPIQASSDG